MMRREIHLFDGAQRELGMIPINAASTGTWKTTNGLAIASIKTLNGLAIASVKTNDGLTP